MDRCRWQGVFGMLATRHLQAYWRSIWIRVTFFPCGMPLILRFAKGQQGYRTTEELISSTVMKHEMDGVNIRCILVDQHDRPLPVRAQQGICRHQYMPFVIFDITDRGEHEMRGIFRLRPLLREQLCGIELRGARTDLVIVVDHKHVVSSPAIRACRMGR